MPKYTAFSLIEVLLAVSLFAIVISGIVSSIVYIRDSSMQIEQRTYATQLAKQGLEAARDIRNRSFNSLSAGTHGISISSGQYTLTGISDTSDNFTRTLTVTNVSSDRKEVSSTVTWSNRFNVEQQVSYTTQLTNWRDTTTQEWQNPTIAQSVNLRGILPPRDIDSYNGTSIISRNAGLDSLALNTVSGITTYGTLTQNSNAIAVEGNYAYIATSTNNAEILVVDIQNTLLPVIIRTINLPTDLDALSIDAANGKLVVGRVNSNNANQPELFIYDISTPTYAAAPNLISTLALNGGVEDLVINSNIVYIASDDNTYPLQLVSIANPQSPTWVQSASDGFGGNTDAKHISFSSNRLVLGLTDGTLYTYDISNPSAPNKATRGVTSMGVALNGLDTYNGYIFASLNGVTDNFRVVDASTPSSPQTISAMTVTGTAGELKYNPSNNRVYLLTSDTNNELLIISSQ